MKPLCRSWPIAVLFALLLPAIVFAQYPRRLRPVKTFDLPKEIPEASGLVAWNGKLYSHNDSGNKPVLYELDTLGRLLRSFRLPARNNDWEELAQDEDFLYIGDIGNNFHARTPLMIYRLEKEALQQNRVQLDSIPFEWPMIEGRNGPRPFNFNCEAMVSAGDSLYLFTKERKRTRVFSLAKKPVKQVAKSCSETDLCFSVTGAYYNEAMKRLVFCGYDGLLQTYLMVFDDASPNGWFPTKGKRIRVRKRFRQTEGIASFDGRAIYLVNEQFLQPWLVKRRQELHLLKL